MTEFILKNGITLFSGKEGYDIWYTRTVQISYSIFKGNIRKAIELGNDCACFSRYKSLFTDLEVVKILRRQGYTVFYYDEDNDGERQFFYLFIEMENVLLKKVLV